MNESVFVSTLERGEPINTHSPDLTFDVFRKAIEHDNFRPPRNYDPLLFLRFEWENISDEAYFSHAKFYFNYYWLAFPISLAYLITIVVLERWMKKRQAFHLKTPLIMWNFALAVFSIYGAFRAVPALISDLAHESTVATLCYVSINCETCRHFRMFIYVFAYSKVVELGDTLFLVLRKRPVIFLHWYHHITVLWFTWYATSALAPVGVYFITMNIFVHSIMYTYFTVSAYGIKVPQLIRMSISFLQIMQMVGGIIAISFTSYYNHVLGDACSSSLRTEIVCMLMYLSYLLLFGNFFYCVYVKGEKPTKVMSLHTLVESMEQMIRNCVYGKPEKKPLDEKDVEMQPFTGEEIIKNRPIGV